MKHDAAITLLVFLCALMIGSALIDLLPLGYTEAAILYLSAVIAAGSFWIGRKK